MSFHGSAGILHAIRTAPQRYGPHQFSDDGFGPAISAASAESAIRICCGMLRTRSSE